MGTLLKKSPHEPVETDQRNFNVTVIRLEQSAVYSRKTNMFRVKAPHRRFLVLSTKSDSRTRTRTIKKTFPVGDDALSPSLNSSGTNPGDSIDLKNVNPERSEPYVSLFFELSKNGFLNRIEGIENDLHELLEFLIKKNHLAISFQVYGNEALLMAVRLSASKTIRVDYDLEEFDSAKTKFFFAIFDGERTVVNGYSNAQDIRSRIEYGLLVE